MGKKRKKTRKMKKWPFVLGALIVLIAAASVWMFGTSRIETEPVIVHGGTDTRSIVVYFTRVGETKGGVDSVSAATPNTNSAEPSKGDTEAAAQLVARVAGADMVQLYTNRYYRDSYAGTAARAFVERYLGLRPAIVEMPDLSSYDTVYIGYPIWWFNAPIAVATFLESEDLNGKTVVPFCTSQDNDVDLSMELIRKAAKGANVLDGLRIHHANEQDVEAWLTRIGIALPEKQASPDETRQLILYFNYSENIQTEGMDVDAVSQASMAGTVAREKGNLLVMAEMLKERTNADVYSLRVSDLYEADFMAMADVARSQKENNEMQEFAEALPDFSQYDVIYLGTPVWWYGAPQAIRTVLRQSDLSGKQIVFFGIHRGSFLSGIPEEILSYQPEAVLVDCFTVDAATDNETTRTQFSAFLDGLE